MLLSRISLAALRTFSEVSKQGSLSKAAVNLHISPSAVSHQMKLLEEQLNAKLFLRRSHGIELTQTGLNLAAKANAAMQQLESGLQQVKGNGLYHLTIAAVPAITQLWLLPRIESFINQYPEIELTIIDQDHLVDFVRQPVDVHLHFGSGEFSGLTSQLIMREYVTPVCAPSLISQEADATTVIQSPSTRRLSYLGFDEDRPGGISWQGWFNQAQLPYPTEQREMRFNHLSPLTSAACSGMGMALGWQQLIQPQLDTEQLVALNQIWVPLKYSYFAVAPDENFHKPEVKAFLAWIYTQCPNL